VKTFLNRILPLLLFIAAGMVLSWLSIYAFWFGVWTFHTVPAARFCDAVGSVILRPAHWVFEFLGGDQSTIFVDPKSFSETNGLIIGVFFYSIFRAFRPHPQPALPPKRPPAETRRIEEKVG
jgi:hypothetical protein